MWSHRLAAEVGSNVLVLSWIMICSNYIQQQ